MADAVVQLRDNLIAQPGALRTVASPVRQAPEEVLAAVGLVGTGSSAVVGVSLRFLPGVLVDFSLGQCSLKRFDLRPGKVGVVEEMHPD